MGKVEGVVENHLRSECKKRGFLCYKWVSPGRIGVPDDIVIGKGKTVFVECKSEVGRLSEMQKLTIEKIADVGGDVRVAYSKEDIDEILDEIDDIKRWKKKEPIDYKELRKSKK